MVTFLLFAAVICILIFVGFRVNLYLFSRGVVGAHAPSAQQSEPVTISSLPARTARRMAKRERDEGLFVARLLLLFFLCLPVVLVVIALSLLLHW